MFLEPNQGNQCKGPQPRLTCILRKPLWRESHLGGAASPRPPRYSHPPLLSLVLGSRAKLLHSHFPHFTRSFFNKTTQLTTPLLSTRTGRIRGYAQSATRLCAPGGALFLLHSQQTPLPLSQAIP